MREIEPFESWVDRYGFLCDWSGITGVWVCPVCAEQDGPYFSPSEMHTGAAEHRQRMHSEMPWKQGTRPCNACGSEQRGARGKCPGCFAQMKTLEAKEVKRMKQEVARDGAWN